MTPPGPEIGCPPPSNIREKLTARRALLGQKGAVPVMFASCALTEDGREDAAAVARLLPISVRRVMSQCAFVTNFGPALRLSAYGGGPESLAHAHNDAIDPYPPFSLKTNSNRMPVGVRTNKRLSLSSGRSIVEYWISSASSFSRYFK